MGIKVTKYYGEEPTNDMSGDFPTYRSNDFKAVRVTINESEYLISDKPKGMSQTTFFHYALGVAIRFHNENKRLADTRPLKISYQVEGQYAK